MSRRAFLKTALAGACGWAIGAVPRAAAGPWVSRRGRLRFVFFTDVHARWEWGTPEALDRCAAAIRARRPELILAGGDLITEGFESTAERVAPRWDLYMQMHGALRPTPHAVIGNHDLVAAQPQDGSAPSPDPRRVFRERLGLERTYGSFDAAGYHFVLLDSIHVTRGPLQYEGRVDEEQLDWLREDLSRISSGTPVVLVSHMPLVTTHFQAVRGTMEPPPANRVVVNNRELLGAFADRRLLLVLQGHLHIEELVRRGGTTFITGGAVCGKWWRGPYYGTSEGFGVVTLDGERVHWEYVPYGWEARRPPNA